MFQVTIHCLQARMAAVRYRLRYVQNLHTTYQWRSKGGQVGARALERRPWGRNSTLLQSF